MHNNMRRLILTLFVSFSLVAAAQNADQRIGELINTEDWFQLNDEYPKLKDSLQLDYLKPMAEAMLALHFNRPEEAVASIGDLLVNYSGQIGSAALNFALLRLQTIGELGRYAEAADGLKAISDQLPEVGSIAATYSYYNALRNIPPMSVSRPQSDVAVPFHLQEYKAKKREPWMREGKRKFKGYHMTVPVTIHGIEKPFVFDAGAEATFITEKTAHELGVRILPDTITLNGTQKGLRAYIDSMRVGDIVCRNMVVYVGLPTMLDSIADGFEAALGLDFIKAVGVTQILFDQGRIVFPAHYPNDSEERNLCLDVGLMMRAERNSIPLLLNFDSGCTTAELYDGYYRKFASEVDAVAVKDTVTTGYYGNVSNVEVKLLPEFTFTVGNTTVTLYEMEVYPPSDAVLQSCDGRMGMSLIRRFHRTTINLNDMNVMFE